MAALRVALLCAFIAVYFVVGQREPGDPDGPRRHHREPPFCNATGTCCQFWKVMNESLYSTFTNCSGSPVGMFPPPCIGHKGHGGGPRPRHRPGVNRTCVWECVYRNQGLLNNGSVNAAAFESKIKSFLTADTNCSNQLSTPITKCLKIVSSPPEGTNCSHIPFMLNTCVSMAARKICRNQQIRKQD